jgi:hypothetical protein
MLLAEMIVQADNGSIRLRIIVCGLHRVAVDHQQVRPQVHDRGHEAKRKYPEKQNGPGGAVSFESVGSGGLLTPPRSRFLFIASALCLRLPSDVQSPGPPVSCSGSPCRVRRGLSPPRWCVLPGAQTKNPAEAGLFVPWIRDALRGHLHLRRGDRRRGCDIGALRYWSTKLARREQRHQQG